MILFTSNLCYSNPVKLTLSRALVCRGVAIILPGSCGGRVRHSLRLVMRRMSALAAGAPSIQAPQDGAKHCVSHRLARPAEIEECK